MYLSNKTDITVIQHKSNKISILRFGMVDVCLPLIDYNGLQYCSIGDATI